MRFYITTSISEEQLETAMDTAAAPVYEPEPSETVANSMSEGNVELIICNLKYVRHYLLT